MTPITVTTWPDEATRTPNSACIWVAETTVDGRNYTACSRHGASNELARQLVAAGISDRPVVIRYRGVVGTITWRSFHAAAMWTYSEGDRPLRRVPYKEQPEGVFLSSGKGENAFHRPRDASRSPTPSKRDAGNAFHVMTISCPPAPGRAFAPRPAGCGLIGPGRFPKAISRGGECDTENFATSTIVNLGRLGFLEPVGRSRRISQH
jgi:hypothetical protein